MACLRIVDPARRLQSCKAALTLSVGSATYDSEHCPGPETSMPSIRFLHTSDLHLGKRFGRFAEETRMALLQARQEILSRLAKLAQAHDATHVLIAGDMFDTETPSDRVQRQALAAMGAAPELQWWIIPGNHDSGAAEPLWASLRSHLPENVHLLMTAEPVQMAPGVMLLPAPCSHRFPGQDLTAWMDECETGDNALRIGLVHGGVLEFGSSAAGGGDSAETISPQRAQAARLDYLALGDWHGRFEVNPRTQYSGSPEPDRFKHAGRGQCLLVELAGPGQAPLVQPIETGQYHWQEVALDLTPETDPEAAVTSLLPPERADWRYHLMLIRASGWVTPPQRLALEQAVARYAPEFCHLELDLSAVGTEHQAGDLDLIARGGALRVAAQELMQAAEDPALAEQDRRVASAALNRLFAYTQGDGDGGERA
ncbi:DNA repair exonuclease [Phaeobacter gallaeciensis]|nr:DNA repair exonuclease [Phaeobacter gallaeciensis]